jgi:putative ABC transport system permease protein
MIHDLRSALRSLARAPGFAGLVIVILALGIGGSAAIFSLVNVLLLRPLPFEESSRLVRMRDEVTRPGEGSWRYNTSPRSFVALRGEDGIFDGVVAQRYRPMTLTAPGEPSRVIAIGVSGGWSEVLGVGPVVGRGFSGGESELGDRARVALLGHELWRSRFGGDPSVVGRGVVLDGERYEVVGVMPRGYNYPYGADLWVPDRFDEDDTAFGPNVVGRLRPELDLPAAQGRLDALSEGLAEAYPGSHGSIRLLAVPIRDDLVSNHPRLGLALLLGAGVLLLLACVNIANLMLVRGSARRSELAVRAAMGAGAGRQARQLLLESLALGVAGGAVGLLLASAMSGLLSGLSMEPDSSLGAFFTDLGLDVRVAAFALLAAVGTAVLFGVAPAWRAARVEPRRVLAAAGRTGEGGRTRWLDGLVVAEVAVALVLMAGAALMVDNLLALQGDDPGHRTEGLYTFRVGLPEARFPGDSARLRFMDRLLTALESEPAVASAGAVHHLPFDDGSSSTAISVEGGPATEGDRRLLVNVRSVAGDYLETMGIRVLAGRSFTAAEMGERRNVVVVNRALAERYWDGSPIGRQIRRGALTDEGPWLEVVGVVGDADENVDLAETLYVPYPLAPLTDMNVVAEVSAGSVGVLRRVVRSLDPDQPLDGLSSVTERVEALYGSQTAATRLMVGFAAFGLLLAVLGIYGVLAYTVARRRRELAVRQALGLTRRGAMAFVVLHSLRLTALGLALGLPAALGFTGLLARVLGGTTRDVAIDIRLMAEHTQLGLPAYAALLLALAAATLAATLPPARTAASTDPGRTLRG